MTVLENIKNLFAQEGIVYELFEHTPVHTSAEAAKVRAMDMSMGAKALVLVADKNPILVVVPGDKRLDFKKLKSSCAIKDLRMATPEEVENLTSLKIGSIPPLGKVLNLVSYFDESFKDKSTVAFNAGSHTVSIKMKAKDLLQVEDPMILSLI